MRHGTDGTDGSDGTDRAPGVDHDYWRRPADSSGPPPAAAEEPPDRSGSPGYSGPPPTTPPSRDWRPEVVAAPPPPRQLPAQDLETIERNEREARSLTYGIGLVAAAVLVVVTCLLCSRVVF